MPNEAPLKTLAKQSGASGEYHELIHNDQVRGAVLKELQAAGKKGGLSGIEIIEGVVLSDEEWTPQNVSDHVMTLLETFSDVFQGLVTSAQKLNRKGILNKLQKDVDKAYSS